ncbi:hypothetical protein SNEBB_010260 [Seison nebaliae]|nr:hypothetical protein SNEBB_010260 [Seison nebaliae]
MPFIGRDWRSPGCIWIRSTNNSWQMQLNSNENNEQHDSSVSSSSSSCSTTSSAILSSNDDENSNFDDSINQENHDNEIALVNNNENNMNNNNNNNNNNNLYEGEEEEEEEEEESKMMNFPFHLIINRNDMKPFAFIHQMIGTKRVDRCISFSEVLMRLQFERGVFNLRQYRYIHSLLRLVIRFKLKELSGTAQRCVFRLIALFIYKTIVTGQHKFIVRQIVAELLAAALDARSYYCYIGSNSVWKRNIDMIKNWNHLLHHYYSVSKQITHTTDTINVLQSNLNVEVAHPKTNEKCSCNLNKLLNCHWNMFDDDEENVQKNCKENYSRNLTEFDMCNEQFTDYNQIHIKRQRCKSDGDKLILPLPEFQSLPTNNEMSYRYKSRKIRKIEFMDLPWHCHKEIIRCMDNSRDIIELSKVNKKLYELSNRHYVWRDLATFHYSVNEIRLILQLLGHKKFVEDLDEFQLLAAIRNYQGNAVDWKRVFDRLEKRFGKQDIYTDMIHRCMNCKCVFWNEIGHHCHFSNNNNNNNNINDEIEMDGDNNENNNNNDRDVIRMLTSLPVTPMKLFDLLKL